MKNDKPLIILIAVVVMLWSGCVEHEDDTSTSQTNLTNATNAAAPDISDINKSELGKENESNVSHIPQNISGSNKDLEVVYLMNISSDRYNKSFSISNVPEQETFVLNHIISKDHPNIFCSGVEPPYPLILKNISINESILIDKRRIKSEHNHIFIPENTIKYVIDTGYIPVNVKHSLPFGNYYALPYKGEITFLGEDYYIYDFDLTEKSMSIVRGEFFNTAGNPPRINYVNYSFEPRMADNSVIRFGETSDYELSNPFCYLTEAKSKNLTKELCCIILCDRYPGEVKDIYYGEDYKYDISIDDIELYYVQLYGAGASLFVHGFVYNTSSSITLEDSETHGDWMIHLGVLPMNESYVDKYKKLTSEDLRRNYILRNITLTYQKPITLREGEALNLDEILPGF
ncbi:MAG: hypothetical protein A7316_10645 [Candidatus Altiarchaeales archaeon WOR_SM1_86-2]|nr:MAG: hypothetical protein A7316_10645 [Candidatus Altiarchaeales archaeon WOR_SM1_86-2]